MSTSAASAKTWLEEKKPTQEQINDVIEKLEARIEQWDGDDQGIQGSLEALDLLHAHIIELNTNTDTPMPNLDASALVPEGNPVELTEDIKKATFDALKHQFGKEFSR